VSDATPFERWSDDLSAICGSYFGVPHRGQDRVAGRISVRAYDTLDVADISDDVSRIVRDRRGIRQDDAEHIFLVMQVEGQLGVDHNSHDTILSPGDCILLDSTKEGNLHNLGHPRRFLSFHLPRQSFLSERGAVPRIGAPLRPAGSTALALRRRLAGVLRGETATGRADLLVDVTHHAFARPGEDLAQLSPSSLASRHDLALEIIESNLRSETLTLPWLAARVGLSPRQLQRSFQARGTSFRETLRAKRYRLVTEHLDRLPRAYGNIAALAFHAGFRDLSNFNRGFRRRFEMSPRAYHVRALARMAQKSEIRVGGAR
jgi:AraC-like DNA-binding protein